MAEINRRQRLWLHISSNWKLVPILVGYMLLVSLYSWLIPPFEGPDEPQHFAYVVWLAEGKGFPPQGGAAWDTPIQQEASQPPLYYWLASIPARLAGTNDPAVVFRPNPYFPSNAPGTVPDNKNVAIHYPSDTNTLHGAWLALYLSRGVSLLFGMLLIVCVYGLAQQVMPEKKGVALAAALLVAVIPQILFIGNIVSNDMATAATGALTLWLLARLVRKGPTLWRGLALGVAFGLATLSKSSSLALALPIAAGLAWLWWTQRSLRRQVVLAGIAALFSTFLVAGWWYIRSWLLYGSPLGLNTHYQAPWALTSTDKRIGLVDEWLEVFYSFWAAFGWGNIKYSGWVYALLAILVLAAIAGLSIAAWRRWSKGRRQGKTEVLLILLALAVIGVSMALEIWMSQVTAPHGRLLFPVLAAIVVLLVVGWRAIHPWLVGLGVGLVLLLALLSPLLLIRPAYALPRFLSTEQINEFTGSERLDWQFGQIAKLLDVEPVVSSAVAGEALRVRLCWQTLATAEQDYSVLVHLVGPNNRVVTRRHTYPGLGSYPTSTWRPDRQFCDIVRLDIPADLNQTLLYKIEIGLFDEETDERLPAYSSQGQLLDHTFAGAVRLQVAEPVTASQEPPGEGVIRLISAEYPQSWLLGADHDMVLRWWMAEEVDQDYTVFIHLRDQATGENVAQGDGPPLDGWYPTSFWSAGELINDTHVVLLPGETVAGIYDLIVGWYDAQSGARLGEEIHLGSIEVKE